MDVTLPVGTDKGVWVYDVATDDWGYRVSSDMPIAKTLIGLGLEGKNYKLVDGGKNIQLISGIYKAHYNSEIYYFAFDEDGKMMTGFVETKAETHKYTLDLNTGKMVDVGATEAAKYYFMESGKYKGALWNQTITIDGVTYKFDEQGRVIEEIKDIVDEAGEWDYDPQTDTWMYAEKDSFGNKQYLRNGAFAIPVQNNIRYYVFDENGKMKTGLTQFQGKTYYLQETGALKGSVYTGPVILGNMYYNFDGTGSLVSSMTLTQAFSLTQIDPSFGNQIMQAMTATQSMNLLPR